MKVVILSIGDELIMGQTVDSNSAWLSARLADLGVMTVYHKTVADDIGATSAAIQEASDAAGLVIATGGLGPTADDLTRQALAAVMRRPLDLHPPSLTKIRAFFKSLGRDMPVSNRVQAMIPRGAEVLENVWGTAPGIKTRIGSAVVYALPGVPGEMMKMAERHIFPAFLHGSGKAIAVESLHTFGAGESTIAEKLGTLMKRDRNPLVGTTVSGGIVTVRIRSERPTLAVAQKNLFATVTEVNQRLGSLIFGRGDDTLSAKVGELALEKNKSLAVAESCTGGMVAQMLTERPGSSGYFLGGWVVYSNAMKNRELGVPTQLINRDGAVSESVARAMVEGTLLRSGANMAVAVTGIAGPEGGTADKPVGTVWIGVGQRQGERCLVTTERFQFPGTRPVIRDRAAKTALNLLRLALGNVS